MSRDVPRRRDETILTAAQPLCAADELLASASCTLRRVHRSVRVFFALLQALCADSANSGGHGTSSASAASPLLPSLVDLATEFIGPLSSSDLDVLAAVDDTQRADIVRMRQRHEEQSAIEELALASLQEALVAALADPVTTPAAKARAVTDATRKRRELAVKRTQRLQSMLELERPFRVALFKWLPTMSLEYGDEGLSSPPTRQSQPTASAASSADLLGHSALRTMAAMDLEGLTTGTTEFAEADAAVERSVHAMLAKSIAALHRRLSQSTAAGATAGKATAPPPQHHNSAPASGAGTFVTVATDLGRSLTRVLQAWPERAQLQVAAATLPAAKPSGAEAKAAGEADAADMMARWVAVDRLLWPRDGDPNKPEESAEVMIRRVKQQAAQLAAAISSADGASRQLAVAPKGAPLQPRGGGSTPSTPSLASAASAQQRGGISIPTTPTTLQKAPTMTPIAAAHSSPDGLGGSSNPSSPNAAIRDVLDSSSTERPGGDPDDDGLPQAKRFAAVYSDELAERIKREREAKEAQEAYDRDVAAMAARSSPQHGEGAEDPDLESGDGASGKRRGDVFRLDTSPGSSPAAGTASKPSPAGPNAASSPRGEQGADAVANASSSKGPSSTTFLTSTTDLGEFASRKKAADTASRSDVTPAAPTASTPASDAVDATTTET